MTLAADIAGDMADMDGYEAMTLKPRNPTASDVSCYGIKGPLRKMQLAILGGMGLGPSDLSVNIDASTASSTVPKQGDKLTIGSTTYTIELVEVVTVGNRYRCVARQES